MKGQSNFDRFILFPIQHSELWEFYKNQVKCFWTPEEVDLAHDRWDLLSPGEQRFLSHVLGFFAAADGIVGENLALRFYGDVDIPEARCFYGFQLAMENIHAEMYALLIDTYIRDPKEKERLFHAIEEYECIGRKAEWAMRWLSESNENSFLDRLVAFASVEGIFFSSSFCAIYWFKKGNRMPGLCTSNEFIARDEGMHCDFAVKLFHSYRPSSLKRVTQIITEATAIEEAFVDEALNLPLLGMNATDMKEYVRFCADRLLKEFGVEGAFYGAKNPFPWMDLI